MSKKTPIKGERGIYRLEDGRMHVRVTARDPMTGRQAERAKTLKAGANIVTARRTRDELMQKLGAEGTAPLQTRPPTLGDYAERWLKRARLRESTRELYVGQLATFILPRLGHLPLDAIGREDLVSWVRWAEGQTYERGGPDGPQQLHYSQGALTGAWRRLVQVLRDGCADHQLPDPVRRVKAPKSKVRKKRREQRTLSWEELGALLEAVAEVASHRHPEAYIGALTGMRPGELYALRFADIDLERGIINVQRAHKRGTIDAVKTDDPREVGLTPRMREMLIEQRRALIAAQHPALPTGLVFPSDAGTPRLPESMKKTWEAARAAAGIEQRVGWQVLRRTFNTLLLRAGIDRITLRASMGHCSEEMTERYAGVPDEMKIEAVSDLERRLSEKRGAR